ncbi:MAG: hypothetical protein KME13_10150 [Myxacorys californica WJT36-NPBG1]|jgi:hypothetical protein|nr:hypothetical protein [Myxacorys californica WJT36-NPBG1]MBW4538171.1 hypothetical protein [Myxacorys chilensis ATA2-1-KO14]
MKTDSDQVKTPGVQHDSETPLPQKPSLLFIVSTSIGVLTLIAVAAGAYYGVAQ